MKHFVFVLFLIVTLQAAGENDLNLTEQEKAYLERKKEITFCGLHEWLPFLQYQKDLPKSMIGKYSEKIGKSIGIPLRFVRTNNWQACLAQTKTGGIDMAVPILHEPNRYAHLVPSIPLEKDFLVFVSKVETPFIYEAKSVRGIKASVYRGHESILGFLRSHYPDIGLTPVADMESGMQNVVSGRSDVYIDALMPSSNYIRLHFPKRLKINSRIPGFVMHGAFGIRKDEPHLVTIMNKALARLEPERKREVFQNWTRVMQEKKIDYTYFWVFSAVALLLLFLLIYRQFLLKREHRKLQKAYDALHVTSSRLREHKKMYEVIFENDSDGILIIENDKFIDCNRAAFEMLKYGSKAGILNRHPGSLSPERQPDGKGSEEKAKAMMRLAVENRGHRFEWLHRQSTGDDIWVEVQLTPFEMKEQTLMLCVWRDITERKQLEAKHAEMDRLLEKRVEEAVADLKKSQAQAKLGSWKYDRVEQCLHWSEETCNIFEITPASECVNRHRFIEAVHPDDIDTIREGFEKSLQTHEPYDVKFRIMMPDGRVKYVKEHCETTFDDDGNPLLSYGTIQDVTVEHLAAEQLRQKEELLFRQSRLAQMGEMISMIAHQWRQPLNAISSTTASLQLKAERGTFEKTFFTSRLDRVSDYVQHLSETIEDFRNFFKPEKVKKQVTFSEVVHGALNIIGIGLKNKNITIDISCDSDAVFLAYDNELKQVVLNMLQNAEDVLLENRVKHPTIAIRCYVECDDRAVLEIADNGGGIKEEIRNRMFEPYTTTKSNRNGTGLGLYMSKTIVEEHCGGTISAYNGIDGAVFRISIPLNTD